MGDSNKECKHRGYVIEVVNTDEYFYCKDIVSVIFKMESLAPRKSEKNINLYKVIDKNEQLLVNIIDEFYDDYNFDLILNNIEKFQFNKEGHFLTYIALIKEIFGKDELKFMDKYNPILNHLISYDVFKHQSKEILKFYKTYNIKTVEDIRNLDDVKEFSIIKDFILLNKDEEGIQSFIDVANSDISDEHKTNKSYQLLVSFALSKYGEIINNLNLIKSFDFNGIFFKKNLQYFNPKEISLYQTVRCKEVKSPVSIIKEECENIMHFEDIDYVLIDNMFGEIYRDNITTPYINTDLKEGKKDIVEFYYKVFENSNEILEFIEEFNEGTIKISKYNMKECCFNEYVHLEYDNYIRNGDVLNNINVSSKLYGIFGNFGSLILKNSFNKVKKKLVNFIEVKGDIDTEFFISIVKSYYIDEKHSRKVIINLLYQPN